MFDLQPANAKTVEAELFDEMETVDEASDDDDDIDEGDDISTSFSFISSKSSASLELLSSAKSETLVERLDSNRSISRSQSLMDRFEICLLLES